MTLLSDRVLARLRETVDQPDLTGTRYRLEGGLGRGGMGAVYAAFDEALGRRVALKVITVPVDPEALFAEARVAARLEHPGVMPIYDIGTLVDGRAYYTMKLVDGLHLDDYTRHDAPLSDRLRVFQKLCDAVAFAHSRGIVHRDLKPSNVMVGPFGEVLVMDWGVGVAGTPRYRAPEQQTMPAESVGPAADVHALGVILRAILPVGSPKRLLAVAARATAVDPSQRYPDAGSLNREIGRYLDGGAVEAYRESTLERAARFYSANQPLLVLILAYVVIRFALFLWSTH
ncbi:MAG TPA: serine/threonine-protein kinase [Acidimicrobiia bacterium]|nr:serine/threonine-protein kinase [Acidimicrobiia bacterium]